MKKLVLVGTMFLGVCFADLICGQAGIKYKTLVKEIDNFRSQRNISRDLMVAFFESYIAFHGEIVGIPEYYLEMPQYALCNYWIQKELQTIVDSNLPMNDKLDLTPYFERMRCYEYFSTCNVYKTSTGETKVNGFSGVACRTITG